MLIVLENGKEKCTLKNLIGPIFEDEDPDNLSTDECLKRFSLSAKNPRKVVEAGEWTYSSAVGPYGGYAMKQKNRTVFENEELESLSKDELRELLDQEKIKNISNYLGGEILKIPKKNSTQKTVFHHLSYEVSCNSLRSPAAKLCSHTLLHLRINIV